MYGEPLRLGGHPLRANGRVCRVAPGALSVPPYVSESCVPGGGSAGGSSIVVVRWVPGTLSLGFGADDELRLPQRQRAVADLLLERALRGVLGLSSDEVCRKRPHVGQGWPGVPHRSGQRFRGSRGCPPSSRETRWSSSFRVILGRQQAEALAARAIREEKNIGALVTEILEAAATKSRAG